MLRLLQDYTEQSKRLQHAIQTFEEISQSLLKEAGHLQIRESSNGPQFEINIQGSRSKGISNMQIFCFDMMLMQLCADRGIGPGFLIHDSHLYDGVDERQKAKALEVGAARAQEFGFQYIVTMNSDDVPTGQLPEGFISTRSVDVDLTDASETGGLFGVRF